MEKRKLDKIIPYDKNPRKNDGAVDKVLESLMRHGQVKPIVLSAKGKPFKEETVVAGHTTLRALERFGAKEAFVVVKEFADEAQFVDYNIRDNKVGEFAEWDEAVLASLASEFEIDLKEMEFDFEVEEEPAEGLTDEDEVPEVPEEPVAKLGQIWKLGEHRLMCGDCLDRSLLIDLIGEDGVDMVLTDPPYGISIVGKNGSVGGGKLAKTGTYSPVANDGDTEVAKKAIEIIKGLSSKVVVIWGGNYYSSQLPDSSCWIVWDKENTGNFADAELAWTNQKTAVRIFKHMWNGMLKSSERGEKRVHPTQKPIELGVWVISQYGEGCETVLDLFGGSGSTLIACEKTKRKCRMMELDPKYCDVIIKRWEDFTGNKAELINAI